MKSLLLLATYWVHLLATVLWIGGIMFILFIALPVAAGRTESGGKEFMGDVAKRFGPLANWCIYILVGTGVIMTWDVSSMQLFEFNNTWSWMFFSKMVLVLVMVVIHFYRGLFLNRKIERTETGDGKVRLQKLSLDLVKVNLSLGILVLLFSVALPVLRV